MRSRRFVSMVLCMAVTLCVALLGARTARAHHSFAVFFDAQKSVTICGVVKEFQFVNPHGLIRLTVQTKDGESQEWRVETNSPSILRRRGWTPDSIQVGEKITIEGWPARDNSHWARLRKAERANGEPIGKPFEPEA